MCWTYQEDMNSEVTAEPHNLREMVDVIENLTPFIADLEERRHGTVGAAKEKCREMSMYAVR